jgi:hypothetical protein
VRVLAETHPLFGHLLAAQGFRRFEGVVFLVVELPDGSPGTIRADATDVLAAQTGVGIATVLDADGLRSLCALVDVLRGRVAAAQRPGKGK